MRGKKRTPEHQAKLNASRLGRKLSPEHGAKIGIANLARNPSGLRVDENGRAFVKLISGWLPRAHVVWVQANGPIPAPGLGMQGDQYCIHHINGDKSDDRIENLELKTKREHIGGHKRAA